MINELHEALLLKRARAGDLQAFAEYVGKPVWRDHGHPRGLPRHIAEVWLPAMDDETKRRLAIVAPVGHAKSLTCQLYILWRVGLDPNIRILFLMSTADQATETAQFLRDVIEGVGEIGRRYRKVFPGIEPNRGRWTSASFSVKRTRITRDPTIRATSVGAKGWQGARTDLVVIDDSVSQEMARSEAEMTDYDAKVRGTLSGRGVAGTRIFIVYTRWSDHDAQYTVEEMGWPILHTPAIGFWDAERDENGEIVIEVIDGRRKPKWGTEALWAEEMPLHEVPGGDPTMCLDYRLFESGPEKFALMYQGDPSLSSGKPKIPSELIIFVDSIDEWLRTTQGTIKRKARAWDIAGTQVAPGKDPDWTVGALAIADTKGTVCFADVIRLRGNDLEVENALVGAARLDGKRVPIFIEQEPGAGSKNLIGSYGRLLNGWELYAVPASHGEGKLDRAGPLSAATYGRRIYMVRANWNRPVIDTLRSFGTAGSTEHDDDADTLAMAFNAVSEPGAGEGLIEHMRKQLPPERVAEIEKQLAAMAALQAKSAVPNTPKENLR